jgi:hypothetical protein
VSFQGQRRHSVRVGVYHVWLFNLCTKPRLDLTRPTRTFSARVSRLALHSVQDNDRPLRVIANIQCVCVILHRQRQPYSSFCPSQRQASQGRRERFRVCVCVCVRGPTIGLLFLCLDYGLHSGVEIATYTYFSLSLLLNQHPYLS